MDKQNLTQIIEMLLTVLPDSTCDHDPSWEYCWNELSDDAQELVVAARHEALDLLRGQTDEWVKDWPTEPGHYWFYGWCSKPLHRDYEPEMILVKVSATATVNVFAYVGNGQFIYRNDGVGVWKKATLPEPPSIGE